MVYSIEFSAGLRANNGQSGASSPRLPPAITPRMAFGARRIPTQTAHIYI